MSVIDRLLHRFDNQQDESGISDSAGSWTSSELRRSILSVGETVRNRLPANEPSPVGLLIQDGRPFVAAFLGILGAGHIPVPLNYFLSSSQLRFICSDARINEVITTAEDREKIRDLNLETVLFSEIEDNKRTDSVEEVEPLRKTTESIDDSDYATILYTSGTTGKPKGVPLTHDNLLSNIRGCEQAMDITPHDRFLTSLPLFHSFGLTCGVLLPFLQGASMHFRSPFTPKTVLQTFEDREITVYLAIPSQYQALARAADRQSNFLPIHKNHERIRLFSGGEPLTETTREATRSAFERPILEGYGLTETSPVISVNRPEDNQPGTAGRPLENLEVRIADPEQPDCKLPEGEEGEIQVTGPSVMESYLRRKKETAKAFTDDDWFRTGDMGAFKENRYLLVTGRLKEVIISAGENIAPVEIENELVKIEGVDRAAVIGRPDSKRGEVPVAFLEVNEELRLSKQDVKQRIRERLGRQREPRSIAFQESLPTGPTGKVLKRELE